MNRPLRNLRPFSQASTITFIAHLRKFGRSDPARVRTAGRSSNGRIAAGPRSRLPRTDGGAVSSSLERVTTLPINSRVQESNLLTHRALKRAERRGLPGGSALAPENVF